MAQPNAVIITGGYLDTNQAKTAHGLIRGTERFRIVAVIDQRSAGRDAGEILDGQKRNIPVFESFAHLRQAGLAVDTCIIGVATKGGVIPENLRALLKEALEMDLHLVNGLHEYLSDIEEIASLAAKRNLTLTDVRKPKKFKDLHFWTGKIREVACPKIAVLGTDCALGKRTTARFLTQAMRQAGYKAEMIYTGQTGWMQGAKYGFIFDSTLNDFISGELEHAIYTCYHNEHPDIIFIEGQSSLRNPSGPAGAEWLVSANATAVVLQHDPVRTHYKDMEHYPALVAQPADEIELIAMYGVKTIALTLNTAHLSVADARSYAVEQEALLGIPVVLPLIDGMDRLAKVFEGMVKPQEVNARGNN